MLPICKTQASKIHHALKSNNIAHIHGKGAIQIIRDTFWHFSNNPPPGPLASDL